MATATEFLLKTTKQQSTEMTKIKAPSKYPNILQMTRPNYCPAALEPTPKATPSLLLGRHIDEPMYPLPNLNHNLEISSLYARPFDQLHAERTYLLGVLQIENEKAIHLLRRIRPMEDTLSLTQNASLRRAAKKEVGWLRSRIKESTLQEKHILARLGQISHEIQSQDRRYQFQKKQSSGPAALTCGQLNGYVAKDMTPTSLNPLSPAFQPQGIPFPQPRIGQPKIQINGYDDYFGPLATIHSASDTTVEGHNYEKESKDSLKEDHSSSNRKILRRPTLDSRSLSLNSAECEILATNIPSLSHPKLKRRASICVDSTQSAIWLCM